MKTIRYSAAGLFVAAALLCGITAQAGTFHNGWTYAIDSNNDGSGGQVYEQLGLAFATQGDKVYVAISSNMPTTGNPVGSARNGSINNGDMIFNFSSHNLDTAAKFNDSLVFGVRFDGNNDSLGNLGSNHTLGVYKNLNMAALSGANSGYATLQDYANAGFARSQDSMADLEDTNGDVKAYFSNGAMLPNIESGTKIGDIALMNRNDLMGKGLDFAHFGIDLGSNGVYGFSFDRSLIPLGGFKMHLFEECINDGMLLSGENGVPEPGTLAMLGAGLLTLGGVLRRRNRK